MDSVQLERKLQSIGKECFVSYFRIFGDETLSNEEVSGILVDERGYRFLASRSRCSAARSIIRTGKAKEAFLMIADSRRVEPEIREIAARMAATR